jgi:hypothetical protein
MEPKSWRLPQDVLVSGDEAPFLGALQESAEHYAAMHARALAANEFEGRAEALWGLVSRGAAALEWCRASIESDDLDLVADTAGVLAWVGTPDPRCLV